MSRLNIFFFGSEKIHPSDVAFFYIGLGAWAIIGSFTVMAVYL